MIRDPAISAIRLADLGSLDLSIPVLTFGAGRPILTLVTGVHGNETAGLFVIDRLLEQIGDFQGQLRVIPSANPLAQAFAMRASPMDHLDLNRIFPGRPDGQLPERIASRLVKVLSDSDLVVDFHSFGLRNPIIAIYADCGEDEVRTETLAFIRAFAPEMIWYLDIRHDHDTEYRGALAPALHLKGVPNFAVEMPINYRMTAEDVDRATRGLLNVMARLGMVAERGDAASAVPRYRREDHYAPASGLFYPEKDIMTPVTSGERIGRITSITRFTTLPVTAPFTGMLLQIHDRAFVTTGTSIFAMGHPVEDEEDPS